MYRVGGPFSEQLLFPDTCNVFLTRAHNKLATYFSNAPKDSSRCLQLTAVNESRSCVKLELQEPEGKKQDLHYSQLLKSLNSAGVSTTILHSELFYLVQKHYSCLHNLAVYVMLNSDRATQRIFHQISDNKELATARWLLFIENFAMEEFFYDVDIPLNCECLVVQKSGLQDKIVLTEVYRIHSTRALKMNQIAIWDLKNEISWTNIGFFDRRRDFEGLVLEGGIISLKLGKIITTAFHNDKAINIYWYFGELWQLLERSLNFTTKLRLPSDGAVGSQNLNGTWNGVFRMILDGQLDVLVFPLVYTGSRMNVIDYLTSVVKTKASVVIRHPDIYSDNWILIIQPFGKYLWTVLLTSALFLGTLLSASVYFGTRHVNGMKIEQPAYLILLGIYLQQGQEFAFRPWSASLVILTSLFCSTVVFIAYTATIISFITIHRTELPFTDFKGLLDDGTYKLGYLANTATAEYFKISADPVIREVYNKIIRPYAATLPRTDGEGMHRTCIEEKYAYIMPGFIPLNKECNLIRMLEVSYSAIAGYIVKKRSPYAKILNQAILLMRENGILQHINSQYQPDDSHDEELLRSVSMRNVVSFFTVLALGILLAIFVLLLEHAWSWRSKSNMSTLSVFTGMKKN